MGRWQRCSSAGTLYSVVHRVKHENSLAESGDTGTGKKEKDKKNRKGKDKENGSVSSSETLPPPPPEEITPPQVVVSRRESRPGGCGVLPRFETFRSLILLVSQCCTKSSYCT